MKPPRKIEADPRREDLEALLSRNQKPLWEKSEFSVAHVPLHPALEKSLEDAQRFKQLERGLEQISRLLDNEERGLAALQKKQGTPPAQRISRLLLVANDGSERFYRECERVLGLHGDRLLCIVVEATSERLAHRLFGPTKPVKALLVTDKEAVSNSLLSLLDESPHSG